MASKTEYLVLPDVFLDHFIFTSHIAGFAREVVKHAETSGRMLAPQRIRLGGNAYNFGFHAARLGSNVTFVAKTSSLVKSLVKSETKGLSFDSRNVRAGFEPSLTVAVEPLTGSRGGLNINSPGGLAQFGPEDLPPALSRGEFDLVGVFNWTGNKRGTDLCKYVFASYSGIKLFDLNSPQLREDVCSIKGFLDLVNIISGNEREILFVSRKLGYFSGDSPSEAAKKLSQVGLTVAMHGDTRSAEFRNQAGVTTSFSRIKAVSSTGAGDAWTAAYSRGYLLGWSPARRLRFANTYAAQFLRSLEKA